MVLETKTCRGSLKSLKRALNNSHNKPVGDTAKFDVMSFVVGLSLKWRQVFDAAVRVSAFGGSCHRLGKQLAQILASSRN